MSKKPELETFLNANHPLVHTKQICIFVDGSYRGRTCGAAVVTYERNNDGIRRIDTRKIQAAKSYHWRRSIQSEIIALSEGVKEAIEKYKNDHVLVFTDNEPLFKFANLYIKCNAEDRLIIKNQYSNPVDDNFSYVCSSISKKELDELCNLLDIIGSATNFSIAKISSKINPSDKLASCALFDAGNVSR